jgi:hypothetical protein
MTSTTRCRILYRNQSFIWDIKLPLKLDRDYLLEVKNGTLFIRNFIAEQGTKSNLLHFPFNTPIESQKIKLHQNRILSLSPIYYPEVASFEKASKTNVAPLADRATISTEDLIFRKGVRRITAASALLSLVVILMNFMDQSPATNEELVPQKFAKLILTKPKPTSNQASSGVSAKSQAQTKAIARAFQSKTVQKSMKSILQGGLTKYSIMATGRSIQSLSQKMLSQTNEVGAGLEKKTQGLLGAMNAGNFQIGSENGYGSGNGTNVKGQGMGHLEIGLNFKEAVVDEGLTKEEVAKVIHSHMNEIRYCYESAILSDPSLAGKVLVDFKIGAQGSVATAQAAENTMNNVQVGGCLVGKLKNWKFPQPRGGVQVAVSYPFIFKSLTR